MAICTEYRLPVATLKYRLDSIIDVGRQNADRETLSTGTGLVDLIYRSGEEEEIYL